MIWIAFEGPDGVGKTTQVRLLKHHFTKKGRDVVDYAQPHLWVRETRDPAFNFVTRRLLFHADNEIVMGLIRNLRKQEVVVLTDRWHPVSERMYSRAGGKDEADFSENLVDAVSMIRDRWSKPHLLPNLVIKLEEKGSVLEERFREKKKSPDVFEHNKDFRAAIRRHYSDFGWDYHVTMASLDCEGLTYDEVHLKILEILAETRVI